MTTRADIQRNNGIVKVDVIHQGPAEIRQNLKTALLGTFGETKQHVISVRELVASVNHPCLTTQNAAGEKQVLFAVLGRNDNKSIRLPDDTINFPELHLGERVNVTAANPNAQSSNTGGVVKVSEDEFRMYIPDVYSFNDLLFRIQKKCRRISSVLDRVGWTQDLGGLDNDRNGQVPGGVGSGTYDVLPPILPHEEEKENQIDLLEFHVRSGGFCELKGTGEFWNSFVVWCSPLFQEITGFPELYCFTDDLFGEDEATDILGEFHEGDLDDFTRYGVISPKSLFTTFEERRDVLVTSDLPLPIERYVKNGEDLHRFVFGYFDIRGKHDLRSERNVENFTMTDDWAFVDPNTCGRQMMDPPSATGFASLVLPSTVPSFNIRVMLRRKQWNFTTNEYKEVEVPLLKHGSDTLVLRMVFVAQV